MASSTPTIKTDPTAAPPNPSPTTLRTLTYYHAGPLFSLSDLTTNISLSSLISSLTRPQSSTSQFSNHFSPLLPQSLEPRSLHPHSIRDADLRALLSCDLALFIYDGAELDAGTVVEYMVAKMADIPSVILRTDFRGGGDQHQVSVADEGEGGEGGVRGDNWNLMSSFWPRTKNVTVDSMGVYKNALAAAMSSPSSPSMSIAEANALASSTLLTHTAQEVIKAMAEVAALPPRMPAHLRKGVYEWLGGMVGWRDGAGAEGNVEEMRNVLEGKIARAMI